MSPCLLPLTVGLVVLATSSRPTGPVHNASQITSNLPLKLQHLIAPDPPTVGKDGITAVFSRAVIRLGSDWGPGSTGDARDDHGVCFP